MYPDQSLYPVDSVPAVVRRINRAFQRADQVQAMERADGTPGEIDFFAPIVADAEAGFGGPLNRSEEHTSELQSLMRISYAVFCLKKKKKRQQAQTRA